MLRLVLILLLVPFGTCVRAQNVAGTVFEVSSAGRTPSAGAFVIVHWTGTRPGIGHYESVCIQAAIARTDAHGRFEIDEPPALRSTFLVWRRDPAVAVYKPGFDGSGKLTLAPTRLDAAQRRSFVDAMSDMGCRDDKGMLVPLADPQGVLPAFRGALVAESPPQAPPKMEVRILRGGAVHPAAP
jgi:hypothetical protein